MSEAVERSLEEAVKRNSVSEAVEPILVQVVERNSPGKKNQCCLLL